MKTKPTRYLRLTGFLVAFIFFGINGLKSQDVKPQKDSPILSGSDSKLEDVVLKADAIFTGEILQLGPITLSAAGGVGYSANKVKVLQVLRGSVGAELSVAFKIRGVSNEQPPEIGTTYIFFVKKVASPDPDPYMVIKLLPATDTTTTRVQKLIATAPADK